MTETPGAATEPLLQEVTAEQRRLLTIVGDVVADTGAWPIYQYVQAKMDDHDLDIDAVLSSLPTITERQLTYSLVRRDRTGGDATPLSLTIAGLTHLERFEPVVRTFLRILDQLADARAKAMFDPQNVVEVTIPIDRLTLGLDMSGMMSVDLRGLLTAEPATWHNQVFQGEDSAWFIRVSPFIRRFRGVQTVEDYIDRLRAWIQPTVTAPPPIPGSPFGLVAAVDYLDVVWRLKFGSRLVTLPGAERVAWLATEATSPAEFNGRLSALGEVLKGFVVLGAAKDGPLRRLEALLTRDLPADAMVRVAPAIKVLDAVADVRNGGQHVGAMWDGRAVMALPSLGLTFPVVEHQAAWRTIQAYVIDALDTIRDEIRATV